MWMDNFTKVYDIKWVGVISEFNEDSEKVIMIKAMKAFFLKLMIHILKNHITFIMIYPFYLKEWSRKACSYFIRWDWIFHTQKILKQVLNHGLVLKKVHRTNEFNNRTWLKPYIDINTDLRKKGKHNFKKHFLKLMYKKVFRKTWMMWGNTETLSL